MKKIGLAFEGGGLKGCYQVGAYYAFLRCHIPISGIVGTSIGAVNAAAIVCGHHKKLLELWEGVNPGKILGFDDSFTAFFNGKIDKLSALKGFNTTIFNILKEKGINTNKFKDLISIVINEEDLQKSKMDFGLVTVKFRKLQPVYLDKNDILSGKLLDSIIASCSLPIFKLEPIIDNNIYIDGGFYDNCPTVMLAQKNYDLVYEIRINGVGRNRKLKYAKTKVITIHPSRNLCNVLELKRTNITDNILMGYYDTLRVLKNYDGYKYVFRHVSDYFIDLITRGLDEKKINKLMLYFNAKTKKEAIIKAVEYVLEKEKVSYYAIYSFYGKIREIKLLKANRNFIYNYVKELSIV